MKGQTRCQANGYSVAVAMRQPQFVALDTKHREVYLSQLGNFSPTERDIFHKICQNWQEQIPYDQFNRHIASLGNGSTSELASLMKKLRRERAGLITTAMEEGQRVRRGIVVTEPHAREFYIWLAEELFVDMLETITAPLPLESLVTGEYGAIPPEAVVRTGFDGLGPFLQDESEEQHLLAVPVPRQDHLLLPSKRLRMFVNLAILKMRYYLGSTNLLGALARMQDTSLIHLKQGCAGKDVNFWIALTGTVEDKSRELEALRTSGVDSTFFTIAYALKRILTVQVQEAQERKRFQEEKNLDQEALVMAVHEAPGHFMAPDQFERLLEGQKEKYGDGFQEFRDEFLTRFVRSQKAKTLPHIVMVNERYIHRDHVYPRFLDEFRYVDAEVRPVMVHRMERNLRGGNRQNDTTFASLSRFDEAILEEVKVLSPMVHDLYQRPAILAEAVIHHLKQNKLVKSADELRERLSLYFDSTTMKPLRPHQWFAIRLPEIFERAFSKLPVWKRVWIRITGKYESYRSAFIGRSVGEPVEPSRRPSGDDPRGGRRPSGAAPAGKQRSEATRGKSGKAPAGGSAKLAKGPQRPRGYNPRQVESAWEQFSSTIKKND